MVETYDLGIFQGQLKLTQDPALKQVNDAAKSPAVQKSISSIGIAAAAAVGAGVFEAIISLAKSSQALSAVFGAFFDMLGALIDIIVMANFEKILKAFEVMARGLQGLMSVLGSGGEGFGSEAGQSFLREFVNGVAEFITALVPALIQLTVVFVDIFIAVFTNPGVIGALVHAAMAMAKAFSVFIIDFLTGAIAGGIIGGLLGGPAGIMVGAQIGGYVGGGIGLATMANNSGGYSGGAGAGFG